MLKHQTACAASYGELATALSSFSTTETHIPLTEGMKGLAEAMTQIAQLETGQANATALVLGDSLAYEAVEAKSAKDALLQRQYNIDELRNSIKTTINKRRTIEKLRAGGSIKPERVNEALDDLEEAAKHEQTLQHRVEAISRNLRPALQTHLRTMNDDMLSIALGQARTMLAYENRKLQIYEGIHSKIARIPERGAMDQSIVYYHQSQPETASVANAASVVPSNSTHAAEPASLPPQHAAHMSPSSSSQHLAASTSALDQSMAQSKFMATQAAIKADMEAQRQREERQRAQFAQARAYQHTKQASLGRAAANTSVASTSPQMPNSAPIASTSGTSGMPTSPPRVPQQQNSGQPQSPLHSGSAGQPQPSQAGHQQNDSQARQGNMSQSMFMPASQPGNAPSQVRPVPQSPSRLQRTTSITHSPSAGVDPLSPGSSQAPFPAAANQGMPSSAPYQPSQYQQQQQLPPQQQQQYYQQQQQQTQQSSHLERPSGPHPNGNMTQSVFLPGRNAQPSLRPAQNLADERKRADARKAASFLAGAF